MTLRIANRKSRQKKVMTYFTALFGHSYGENDQIEDIFQPAYWSLRLPILHEKLHNPTLVGIRTDNLPIVRHTHYASINRFMIVHMSTYLFLYKCYQRSQNVGLHNTVNSNQLIKQQCSHFQSTIRL
jgi:hypothetical protein